MKTKTYTLSINSEVFEAFKEVSNKSGIKVSTWVTQKMREFLESNQNELITTGKPKSKQK